MPLCYPLHATLVLVRTCHCVIHYMQALVLVRTCYSVIHYMQALVLVRTSYCAHATLLSIACNISLGAHMPLCYPLRAT